jgi:lipase chaperone LimK
LKSINLTYVSAILLFIAVSVALLNQPSGIVVDNNTLISANTNPENVSDHHGQADFSNTSKHSDLILPDTLPATLADLDLSLNVSIDENNHLIVDEKLKDIFDTYLSALGELELDVVIQYIRNHLQAMLTEPALNESYVLLDQYIAYREELVNLQSFLDENSGTMSELEKLQFKKAKLNDVRHQFFDQQAYAAFFEKEEKYDDFLLGSLKIAQDEQLTAEQKQLGLSLLEDDLPEQMKASRHKVMGHGELYHEVVTMKESGASAQEIYDARAQALGGQAAQALSELDIEREKWKLRFDLFVVKKQALQSSNLSEEDKASAINEILTRSFTQIEQLRVRALSSSL